MKESVRKRLAAKRDAETAHLESIVFGGKPDDEREEEAPAVKRVPASKEEEEDDEDVEEDEAEGEEDDGMQPSTTPAADEEAGTKMRKKRGRSASDASCAAAAPAAAWVDPDDAQLRVDLKSKGKSRKLRRSHAETILTGPEYERRLREQFEKVHGTVAWAHREQEMDDPSDCDSEEELPATSAKTLARGDALAPKKLDIARLREVVIEPGEKTGPAVIQALQFHPTSELLLTGGFDKKLRLYSVDGEENTKVSTHFFKDFPICSASFSPTGEEVLLLGRNDKMWCMDVQSGQASEVKHLVAAHNKNYRDVAVGPCPEDNPGLRCSRMYSVLSGTEAFVCDMKTKQPIKTFQMGAACRASLFSSHSDSLVTADAENIIYEWDLRAGRCRQRVKDLWATGITTLAMSRVSKNRPSPFLAVGTASGNVDFYDLGAGGSSGSFGGATGLGKLSKEPFRTMDNLTTRITSLQFHHESELMLAASNHEKDALKVLHTASSTVFENWPTQRTPLRRVTAVSLSRRGGFLAMGNDKGRVLLYRLNHYAVGG